MANATSIVQSASRFFNDTAVYRNMAAAAQTFYPNEMIGLDASGNATSCDDTAGVKFDGLFGASPQLKQDTGVAGKGPLGMGLRVDRPLSFTMKIAAAAAGDEGRLCFAKFNNEVQYVPGTFGNYVGVVYRVVSATEVAITPPWMMFGSEFGNVVTPAVLTGNVNNYNPPGLFAARELRMASDAGGDRNITGIVAGFHGQRLRIVNIGTVDELILNNQNAGSSAGNKFLTSAGADATVNEGGIIELFYDAVSSSGVWRPLVV